MNSFETTIFEMQRLFHLKILEQLTGQGNNGLQSITDSSSFEMKNCRSKLGLKAVVGRRKTMSLYDYPLEEGDDDDEYGVEFFAFGGAGTNGCSYCGVVQSLEERGLLKKIKYWVGTSAGAIVVGGIAMGADSKFLCSRLSATDLSKFLDYGGRSSHDSWWSKLLDYHYSITELISKLGAARGQEFRNWIQKIIVELGYPEDITFSQLYTRTGNHLVIVTTDLNTYDVLYLSRITYPNMPIAIAIHVSMIIPFIFQPISIKDSLTEVPRLMLDGAILDNFPINACDPQTSSGRLLGINRKAIGAFTTSNGQWGPPQTQVDGFMKFSTTLIATMFRQLEILQSHQPYFWDRVIPINTFGHSPVDFDITTDCTDKLIKSGYDETEKFLEERRQMIRTRGKLPGNLFIPIAHHQKVTEEGSVPVAGTNTWIFPLTNDNLRDTLFYSPNPEVRKARNVVGL
jgi:NTE family protein